MAAQVCPYCVEPIVGKVQREHVFPNSWYPDGTDSASTRPLVPSCATCNGEYGKIEARLLSVWGLGVPNDKPASKGIPRRVLRSLDPTAARGPRDIAMRDRALRATRRKRHVLPAGGAGAFPTVEKRPERWGTAKSGLWIKGAPALPLSPADVEAFTRKLVRGLFFIGNGVPLGKQVVIETFVPSRESWPEIGAMIRDKKLVSGGVPPGFVFWPAKASDNPEATLWFFRIWGAYVLGAATTPGPSQISGRDAS